MRLSFVKVRLVLTVLMVLAVLLLSPPFAVADEKADLLQKMQLMELRFASLQGEIGYLTSIGNMIGERISNKTTERDKIKEEFDKSQNRLKQIQAEESRPPAPVPESKKK